MWMISSVHIFRYIMDWYSSSFKNEYVNCKYELHTIKLGCGKKDSWGMGRNKFSSLVQTRIKQAIQKWWTFQFSEFYFFLLSIPKRRFCYINIPFLFTTSHDMESWIKNSDLKIFKMGKKQGISYRKNTEMCLHVICIYMASMLGSEGR